MKNFLFQVLFILLLGFAAQRYLPFWSVALAGGLAGFIFPFRNSLASFGAGFLAAALLWLGYGIFVSSGNETLSEKMGGLFMIGGAGLIAVTGLVGGLLGGLGAMTGNLARALFWKNAAQAG